MAIVTIPLALFSGFVLDINSIPTILKPIELLSFFKYVYEALIINEFNDLNNCKGGICNVPESMGFTDGYLTCIIILGVLAVLFRVIGLIVFNF